MAFPTSVNSQITDSVTQTNVSVLGQAPAMALGALLQGAAHSLQLSMQNAVANQQAMNQIGNAVATRCVESLLDRPAKP